METDEELFINPWESDANRIINSLTIKYLRAYKELERLAKTSGVVQAKTVQDTLMDIFRWELIARFKIPFTIDGQNAVTLYRPLIYKMWGYVPFVGGVASKFLQNSLFLIFDKFKYDTEPFDDAYYFKVVDFMKKLADYKDNINKSYLRAFLFNNTIVYLEYKTTFMLGEKGNYFVYFRPLEPDEEEVRNAMVDLYYTVADLAGKD
jgi:hypothetical protein